MTTFSIIIPVYNVAPYLRECLDSVFEAAKTLNEKCEARGGKCGAVEIICVDDGSTDGSGAILDEYATMDKRFRVMHQENAGVSAARNAALEVATGDWILFLDADDVVNPILLETVWRTVERHPSADLVWYRGEEFPVDGKMNWTLESADAKVLVHACSDALYEKPFFTSFCLLAYKASIAKPLRFPRYAVGEDNVYKVQALLAASCIVEVPLALHGYRSRPGSANRSATTFCAIINMIDWRRDLVNHVIRTTKKYDPAFVQQWLFDIVQLWYRRQFWNMNAREIRKAWFHRQGVLWSLAIQPRLRFPARLGCVACCLCPFQWFALRALSCCNKLSRM